MRNKFALCEHPRCPKDHCCFKKSNTFKVVTDEEGRLVSFMRTQCTVKGCKQQLSDMTIPAAN